MGEGETVDDAVVREKGAKGSVNEFAVVITLHALNESMKLSEDVGKETLEGGGSLGFVA